MTGAGVILSGVEEVLKTAQEKTTSMSSGRSIILGTSGRLSQQCTKTKKAPIKGLSGILFERKSHFNLTDFPFWFSGLFCHIVQQGLYNHVLHFLLVGVLGELAVSF